MLQGALRALPLLFRFPCRPALRAPAFHFADGAFHEILVRILGHVLCGGGSLHGRDAWEKDGSGATAGAHQSKLLRVEAIRAKPHCSPQASDPSHISCSIRRETKKRVEPKHVGKVGFRGVAIPRGFCLCSTHSFSRRPASRAAIVILSPQPSVAGPAESVLTLEGADAETRFGARSPRVGFHAHRTIFLHATLLHWSLVRPCRQARASSPLAHWFYDCGRTLCGSDAASSGRLLVLRQGKLCTNSAARSGRKRQRLLHLVFGPASIYGVA